ncbi:SH3 domain-containing protein [Synechococcus sp. R70.1]|uniref:SH3 domain-containing protein n=1 Tax=Synechococcus sp. R70.1 TaxID=2964531 RepID=UPI0039C3299D
MANYPVRGRSSPAVGSFPFGTLMALSLSVGALAALGWQAWQFMAPLLAPPAVPQFPRAVRVEPLPRPTSLPFSPSARPTQRESPLAVGSLDSTAFPPGSRGRVIEPLGLAIRSKPSVEGAYQGGIGAGEIVTVLEYSADGRWQRVRRELNGQEGWVRAGNLGPVEGAAVASAPLPATSRVESTPNSTPSPIRPLVETSLAPGERGRVIEPIGLALRATPDREGAYIGGVPMNEVVEVLEYSADGRWQRIRRQNGQEGWVRAGNLAQE